MKDLVTELTGSLSFVVGVLLVAVALLALLLLILLNRARDAARYADLEGGRPTGSGGGEGASLEVLDLRTSPTEGEMKESARRALELIGQYQPGRRGRYEIPWFLTLGQTDSGKSNLLANTGLRPPFGEPDEADRGCLWWLFDRAVVLDVAGDLVLRLDTATSDQPSWRALLELVRQSRPQRPIDGALVTLPLPQLMTYDPAIPATQAALAHQAELLRAKLEEARQVLGVEFPVFTVVTQCDRLPGFAELVSTLEPGETAQMFGWSVRTSPAIAYSQSWVDDAFNSVTGALDQHQLRSLQDGKVPAAARAWLALPATLGMLREPVRIFWSQIFGGGTLDSALPVRGLYFTGGVGFESEGADRHPPVPGYRTFERGSETGGHHRIDFVSDLFARKILFEWSLARPIKSVARRAKSLRFALQVALAASLIVGPAGILLAKRSLAREAETLRCRFLIPARCSLARTPLAASPSRDSALAVLRAIEPVESYTLRSPLLPTSWWNRFRAPVRQTAVDAYGRVVFPALAQSLDRELADLVARPALARREAPVRELSALPEYRELDAFVGEAVRIDEQVHVYQDVAPETCGADEGRLLDGFQALVRGYAPEVPANPPSSARGFYQDVLCLATGPTFPHDAHKRQLQYRVIDLSADATRRLFEENVLIEDLDTLQAQIDELARNAPPSSQANAVYTELVDQIDRTRTDLGRPEAAFAGQTSANLGAAYRQLTDRVARLDLLGPGVARTMNQQAADGFEAFQKRLAAYATEPTGALLAQDKGKVELRLSPNVLGLETALRSLLKGYTAPRRGEPFTAPAPKGTYLVWNAQTLQQAVALAGDYDAFMSKSFAGFPGLQQVVQGSSRGSVEENVLDLAAQAQSFPAAPDLDQASRAQREAFLATQVDNLVLASAPLNALLATLSKPSAQPPPVSGCSRASTLAYCRLGRALLAQELEMADQLDALFLELPLYTPVANAFAGWEGLTGENLAWRAFSVEDAAGLAAYLTNQRRIVQTLDSRYGKPILTAVPLGPDVGTPSSPAVRRWQLVQADLADYQNKVPENPIQALESYITTGMGTATAASCLSVRAASPACFASTTAAERATDAPPCDPFLVFRARLQEKFEPRCTELNYGEGVAAYGRIKTAFDQQLAGRYPFVVDPNDTERVATPAGLDAFYKVYDADKGRVENLLKASLESRRAQPPLPSSPWSERTEEEVQRFLDQMAAVRTFFAPYLDRDARSGTASGASQEAAATSDAAPPAAPGSAGASGRQRLPSQPAFGVRVDVRPAPNAEQGGNEVITRSLAFSSPTPPPGAAPVWVYGTPIRLSLRWAQDALAVPKPAVQGSDFTVSTPPDRTVTWTYSDPWALLHLLSAKAQRNGPEGRLQLDVPVQSAPSIPGSDPKKAPPVPAVVSPSTLYLDVTLTAPNATQTELSVPAFPAAAPEGSS